MKMLQLFLLFIGMGVAFSATFDVYGIDGKHLSRFSADELTRNVIANNTAHLSRSFVIKEVGGSSSTTQLPKGTISEERFAISSSDFTASSEKWIEADKNENISICLDDSSSGGWATDLNSRIESSGCLQVRTPNLAGSAKVEFWLTDSVDVYKINIAVGMKLIDLSTQRHKVGAYDEYREKSNFVFYTDIFDSAASAKDEEANRIYSYPERMVSVDAQYLVDKYMVTNCEFVQALWDSVPSPSAVSKMNVNNAFRRFLTMWSDRKASSKKGETCTALDSATNYLTLHEALLYANARSVREGLTPVYNIEVYTDTVPKLWSDSSFAIVGESLKKGTTFKIKVTYNQESDGYRLPFYDERVIFARAGDTTGHFAWGDSQNIDSAKAMAWFGDSIASEKMNWYASIPPVGLKKPNAFGLYDMFGLAAEFALFPGENPYINRKNTPAVLMGGGILTTTWDSTAAKNTSRQLWSLITYSHRLYNEGGRESGFRLVRRLKKE